MSYGLVLIRLITEANFFVVFIALIVIFFLLGLILGNMFNRPGKGSKIKSDNITSVPDAKGKPQKAATIGQDNQENVENQDADQNQQQRNSRSRYYDWW
jgi:preprotein translocase subunit SecG